MVTQRRQVHQLNHWTNLAKGRQALWARVDDLIRIEGEIGSKRSQIDQVGGSAAVLRGKVTDWLIG